MDRSDPPPRDSHDTCGDCAHAQRFGRQLDQRLCGRYPPSVFPMQAQGGIAGVTLRPQVKVDDDACGEFKRRASLT